MPGLDIYTLNVVTCVCMLLAAGALFLVHRLNRDSHGIGRCVLACLLFAAGFAMLPLRIVLPGRTIIFAANIALFAGTICLVDGIRAFRDLPRPVVFYAAISAAFLAAFCWYLFVRDDMSARVAVDSFFMGLLAFVAAAAMVSSVPVRDRSVYWSTAAGFASHGLALCARGCIALFGAPFAVLQPRAVDFLNIATLNVAAIGCAFGLSMATNLRLQRRTERLAHYDPLTSLPNRRLFEERLEQAERRALAGGGRIGLIYCDLDDFKGINDTLGHGGGDKALRSVAGRLRGLISEDVCLARIGGDEFVVLLENAPPREAVLAMIDRLIQGAAGEVEFEGRTAAVHISCGMAIFPDDVGSASDLIRLADAGMYMMKQHGRFSAAAKQ